MRTSSESSAALAADVSSAGEHASSPYAQSGLHTRIQRGRGWAVHAFTTLGIVAAMLALRDIIAGRPDHAVIWMLLTLLIDGVDGPIARAIHVGELVPRIDGFLLDLVIDFTTCAIVPAAFMYQFGVVPRDNWGVTVLSGVVLTSAIWFARKDMMTEENWFRGFPAAWNLVAPTVMFAHVPTGARLTVIIALALFQLTNVPFPHIARARFMRPYTLLAATCWIGAIAAATLLYPNSNLLVSVLLYTGSTYFIILAVLRGLSTVMNFSPTAARRSPRWWPRDFPTRGHEFSPPWSGR